MDKRNASNYASPLVSSGLELDNASVISDSSAAGAGATGTGGSTVNVIDNVLSTSSTDALSANQGKLLQDQITALNFNPEGQFAGAAATFAALPSTTSDGNAVNNGDWAALTADDGGNLRGIYTYNGAAYVFVMGLAEDTFVVVNDTLTSTSTTEALSANQGKALKDEQDLQTSALGQGAGNSDMGTFTGDTISDAGTAKAALQELETAVETKGRHYVIDRRVTILPLGTAPTAGDTPDLSANSTAEVAYEANGKVVEYWSYDGTSWTLIYQQDTFAVDASGFTGNLATTDDTPQEIADKVDALVLNVSNNVVRPNNTENVEPSGLEVVDPADGDLAFVELDNGSVEHWRRASGIWTRDFINREKNSYSVTVSTGVNAPIDFDLHVSYVLLIDATSTGDVTIENSSTTNLDVGEKIRFVFGATDAVDRNVVFGSDYVNPDNTGVGTIVLAASDPTYRVLEFVRTGLNFATLVSDTLVQAADLQSNKIDASGAAYLDTLPASTNNGVVRLYTGIDFTNSATLAVAVGETLNGVTDGTFLFSNYAVGTQFRADEVNGGWVVSVVGASEQSFNGARFELTSADISSNWSISNPSDFTFATASDGGGCVFPFTSTRYNSGWTLAVPTSAEWVDGSNSTQAFAARINDTYMSPEKAGLYRFTFNMVDPINAEVNNGSNQGALIAALAIDGVIVQYLDLNTDGEPQGRVFVQQVNASQKVQIGVVSADLDTGDDFSLAAALNEADAQFSTGADVIHLYVDIELAQQSETVLAGMVAPEGLDYVSITDPDFGLTGLAAGPLDLDATGLLVLDDSGLIDTATNRVVIAKAGKYEATFSSQLASGAQSIFIGKNGTRIAEGRADDGATHPSVQVIVDMAQGDYFEFEYELINAQRPSVTVKQLPVSTVVMPDAVPVEDVRIVEYARQSALGFDVTYSLDSGRTWNELIADYEYLEFKYLLDLTSFAQDVAVTVIVPTSEIDPNVYHRAEYGAAFASLLPQALTTGDFSWPSSQGSSLDGISLEIVGVKAQKTVINTTDTPVSLTQTGTPLSATSTKHYVLQSDGNGGIVNVLAHEFEIVSGVDWSCNHLTGELIQRGLDTNSATGNITITFPQPFLNGNYKVATSVAVGSGGVSRTASAHTQTSTSFQCMRSLSGNSAATSIDVGWIAIGYKP